MTNQPALLDPDETDSMPERVYVACRPDEDNGGVMLETREVRQQQAVLTYSSLGGLIEGCGADQPWLAMPTARLAGMAHEEGSGNSAWEPRSFRFSILLDTPIPAELRGTAGGLAGDEARWDDESSEDWTLVHVACQPHTEEQIDEVRPELQPMPGEVLAMMAYTSPQAVEAACGPHQHSVPIPAGVLGQARRAAGAHTICLDTPLPKHLRHGADERS